MTEDKISELEDRLIEFTQSEQQRAQDKIEKKTDSQTWENTKRWGIYIIKDPEGLEQENETGRVFTEIIVEHFTSFVKDMNLQTLKSWRYPI